MYVCWDEGVGGAFPLVTSLVGMYSVCTEWHLVCPGIYREDVPDAKKRLSNGVKPSNQQVFAPCLRPTDPSGVSHGDGFAGLFWENGACGDAVASLRDDKLEEAAGGMANSKSMDQEKQCEQLVNVPSSGQAIACADE